MKALIVAAAVLGLAMSALAAAPKPAPTPEELAKKAAEVDKRMQDELKKVEEALASVKAADVAKPRKVLVFTLCRGFKHDSIPLGTKTLELMGKKTGAFSIVASDDPNVFDADNLKQFDAVVMNNTTGTLFDSPALKKSLADFVKEGKGLCGIHAACDCFYNWAEYGDMMGGFFAGHPFSKIVVKNEDPKSPINAAFKGEGFEITDEMYTFKAPYSREKLRILLSIDMEKTKLEPDPKREGFKKGENRDDHDYAISWIREYGKGRVFYCSFGHQHQIFWTPAILQHYLDGIQYAIGDLKADATPSAKPKTGAAHGGAVRGLAGADKPEAKAATPTYKVGEWSDLFNGKDLTGWQTKEGAWKIEDGALVAQPKGTDIWTTTRFGDFELELEFRHDPDQKGGNSGVFLRCDKISNWLHTSFEIQVLNNYGKADVGKHDCGALYDCLAPSKNGLTKQGEWQKFHFTFKGNLLMIELNGQKIIDCNLDDWKEARKNPDGSPNKFNIAYKDMAKDGLVGLQYHGDPIMYRNIKIKPLSEPKAPEAKK